MFQSWFNNFKKVQYDIEKFGFCPKKWDFDEHQIFDECIQMCDEFLQKTGKNNPEWTK